MISNATASSCTRGGCIRFSCKLLSYFTVLTDRFELPECGLFNAIRRRVLPLHRYAVCPVADSVDSNEQALLR